MRFECASRTHVGLKRKINEDSILVETDRGLWAVADGMGGHEAGEVASAMVVDALRALPSTSDLDELAASAEDALSTTNRELIHLARSNGLDKTIGTTVVGLAIADGQFRCFWSGDSRGYRLRDGMISRVTRDHSLVQQLVDSGIIKEEEAELHESSSVITRAVGVAEQFAMDVVGGEVQAGDLFLLASDGLTRVLNDREIAIEIERSTLEQAADNLLETVLERGAPDNVSIILTQAV
jgi:serine/threonine protein phosphatase PrpC